MSAAVGSQRLRFAHVFATFGRGGPQVRAVQLMQHLGDTVEHVVMAMDGCTDAAGMLDDNTRERVSFASPPPLARGGFGAMRKAQRAWLRTVQPNLVLTYNWGSIETVAAARSARLPLVHHEDGFGPEEASKRLLRRSLFRRWLLRKVPVVVPSTVLSAIAKDEWGVRDASLHHLVNGVDLERFAPRARAGDDAFDAAALAQDAFVLGSVGGLRPEKDHHNLLHALTRLPANVVAVIVGSGALEGDLHALVTQFELDDRVVFAGHTNDTAASYARFDAFVLSSRTEQMPIAMLEAMACGLPVVATDVGDVRRVLPSEPDPMVVPREDADALAAGVLRVLEDPELRRQLGQANRQTVEERYEATACLERFAQLYRDCAR
ncbi:MAG: glycosyltransferase family 4 protein [Planctomycetota bacterium]